jgi:secreted Zn-dependent insulinase-like peptidase
MNISPACPNPPLPLGTSLESTALVNVLAHLLCEPAFDILRTKETLGYIVYSAKKLNAHIVGLQVR